MPQTQKKHAKIAVRKSSAGLGLFATDKIAKGEFIIEYVGPLLTDKEADKKGGKYLFEVDKDKTIDGSARSNTARYINHSCDANCEALNESGHIRIYAKKIIPEGEELTYNYGKEYFDEFLSGGRCRCRKCASR